jgi:hypothetical protein
MDGWLLTEAVRENGDYIIQRTVILLKDYEKATQDNCFQTRFEGSNFVTEQDVKKKTPYIIIYCFRVSMLGCYESGKCYERPSCFERG